MEHPERILVHACCASCSSHVLVHLSERFEVTAFFFNPNIQPESEYRLRLEETKRLCEDLGIELIVDEGGFGEWDAATSPFAHLPERSRRCRICYRLRLERTAREAAGRGFGLFTSTLSVSPHKVHAWIVEEGRAGGEKYGVTFLEDDFKKKDGFAISCRRSREYGFTRQDYCGCLYSLEEARERRRKRSMEDRG